MALLAIAGLAGGLSPLGCQRGTREVVVYASVDQPFSEPTEEATGDDGGGLGPQDSCSQAHPGGGGGHLLLAPPPFGTDEDRHIE